MHPYKWTLVIFIYLWVHLTGAEQSNKPSFKVESYSLLVNFFLGFFLGYKEIKK